MSGFFFCCTLGEESDECRNRGGGSEVETPTPGTGVSNGPRSGDGGSDDRGEEALDNVGDNGHSSSTCRVTASLMSLCRSKDVDKFGRGTIIGPGIRFDDVGQDDLW